MEGSAFDRFTRAISRAGSRRHLLGVLTSVPLGGLLSQWNDGATDAKGKRRRRRRRKGKRKRKGGEGPDPSSCTSATDCASGACCQGECCKSPANQCNLEGLCCAPNCAGRRCGPDGCGGEGDCGKCGSGQTCDEESGQCEGPPCIAHLQPCTSVDQCCDTDHTACSPNNVIIGQDVCCSTLGGTCTSGGPSGDCCGVNVPSGEDYAYCSPEGTCGGQGAGCRFNEACLSGQCCKANPNDDSGICSGPDGCCRTLRQPCTSAEQCCSTDNKTACAPNNVVIGEDVCCSTLGGACTSGGPSGDCCGVTVPGGADYAYCSPGGACGGPGAVCRFNEVCVSGQCCKANPNDDSGICGGPSGC